MKKEYKLGIILIVLAVVFTIIGSTFAYWNWQTSSGQLMDVTFTIASGFTCGADGGGNITSSQVSLAPAECTNSNYAIKRTVKVSTTQSSGATIYLNMNLKVNSISANLAASENFKYALTTSSTSCESGIMAEGTFYETEANDELPLLTNERYMASTSNDTFYLWIWLDKEETNNNTQNGTFEFTLSGECTDQEPTKIYAPWGEEVDQYTRINFRDISSASNGQGLYLFQPTKNDTNPIYYYRGAVSNNNVLFGNFCWKIVRTTETGGVKIVYSGTPTSGSCINTTGTAAQLSGTTVEFSASYTSPADVGYMQGTRYAYSTRASASLAESYKYGNSFRYYSGTYILTDVIDSTGNWASDYNTLNNNHYTCFNNTGICESVYYIYRTTSGMARYITLTDGKSVEVAIDEMLTSSSNITSSTIKNFIDNWYTTNLSTEEANLEDTVWCNDREIYQLGGFDPDGGDTVTNFELYFKPYERAQILYYPRLTCKSNNDAFTKSSSNGNGSLSNPIGLLTVDEGMLAGVQYNTSNNTYYLYTGRFFWLGSPNAFSYNVAREWNVDSTGSLNFDDLEVSYGARPAVSLKPGAIWSGNGTSDSPYTVNWS